MQNLEHPEQEPIDITGEVGPKIHLQELVDQGLGFWNEDSEFCTILPYPDQPPLHP